MTTSPDDASQNPRKHRVRLHSIIRRMHELFSARMPKRGKKPLIEAEYFLSKLPGSRLSIVKARRALGVESKAMHNKHYWMFPTHSLEVALEKISGGRTSPMYRVRRAQDFTPILKESLAAVLEGHKYDIHAKIVHDEIRAYQGGRRFKNMWTYRAKKELNVKHVWAEDGWHWVWAPDTVIDWLELALPQGGIDISVPAIEIYDRALKEKGWSNLVMQQAMRTSPMFARTRKDKQDHWYLTVANLRDSPEEGDEHVAP